MDRAPRSAAVRFPSLDFALGETLAHLHSLWQAGRVRRHTDADGVVRFAA